jgi:hypothetical protein
MDAASASASKAASDESAAPKPPAPEQSGNPPPAQEPKPDDLRAMFKMFTKDVTTSMKVETVWRPRFQAANVDPNSCRAIPL